MIAELLSGYITSFIEATGYASVFILMMMESMVFPVPSEAVMPFAGFLIAESKFTFFLVGLFSTLGSIAGSLLSYYIGLYGGKPFLNKYGKYFLLSEKELKFTEEFFKRHGSITIFISRFIPVVRHLISLPAGLAKMNMLKFLVYTVIGAGAWNIFLAFVGFYLKQNWKIVMQYSKTIDIIVVVLIIVALAFFVYAHLKNNKNNIIRKPAYHG